MSFPSPLAPLIASAARFPNINKEEDDPFAAPLDTGGLDKNDPTSFAAPAPAAPAPTEPWRPLQQRTMVNPEREAERKRKEALRGALQQQQRQQQGTTPLSGEGSRRYANPEREAKRKSGKFGG